MKVSIGLNYFYQRSANEGSLFLLFYLCLFISEDTPVKLSEAWTRGYIGGLPKNF